jgi:hypothetical protein
MRWTLTILSVMTGLACSGAHAADASSVEADGTVTIRPGEVFEIVFPNRDDLTHPQFSRALDHIDSKVPGYHRPDPNSAPPTGPALMSFEFKQQGGMLILEVRNDTGLSIKYDATMVVRGQSAHTSICPIFPGTMGLEQWMDPIAMLKLSGFRTADPSNWACN